MGKAAAGPSGIVLIPLTLSLLHNPPNGFAIGFKNGGLSGSAPFK